MEKGAEKKRKREEIVQEAKKFFNAYKKEMRQSADKSTKIDFQTIAEFSPVLSESLMDFPEDTISAMEEALEEAFSNLMKNSRIRIDNLPKTSYLRVREIRAKHLDQLLWVEGIVRQASDVRPQVINAKFECPNCGAVLSVLQIDKKFHEPSKCSCMWKGQFRLLSKQMVDVQRLVIEESPDSLEGGEQPKRVNVFLKEDLVEPKMEEKATPGSKIKIYGVLKEVPISLQAGAISTMSDIAIEANNVIQMEESFEDLKISEEETKKILELAADPNLYKRLSKSIAQSIYGFDNIKEALILQLFGGVKKEKSDGGSARGDIHILLVGDPGVAKSVMLKFISSIAPKGRYVSGKAATSAGLTAAVVKDEFLKGWSLEAGAMVLANKGLVCIDEIEKMTEQDRSAMHEAMEQQTVSIAKANIHATLRAETTVLAAGNPKLGRFDPSTPIPQQIDISPALLSRFDVIFIMRDLPNKAKDEAIATHVLEEHAHGITRDIIDPKLLRKYISYSKQKIKPKLTEEAIEEIKSFYVNLRNQSGRTDSDIKPIPITARQLEGIIRLSEACARMRLSDVVKREDSKKAIEILKVSLMQVGYDEETKSFDIDKMTTGITSSKRSKILLVRDTIYNLESRVGKMIPLEDLEREVLGKLKPEELEEALSQLKKSGEIFSPNNKHIQRTSR